MTSSISASHTINIVERMTLQLRGEATNFFNLVSLSNPSGTTLSSSSFGKITSASSPRIIQLARDLLSNPQYPSAKEMLAGYEAVFGQRLYGGIVWLA